MLFAAFFSAVLLAVTSFARSFKEAQAYLIPLMLVVDRARHAVDDSRTEAAGAAGRDAAAQHRALGPRPAASRPRRRPGHRVLGRHLDGPVRGGGDRRRGPHLRDRRDPLRQPRNVVRSVSPPVPRRPPRPRRRAPCCAWPSCSPPTSWRRTCWPARRWSRSTAACLLAALVTILVFLQIPLATAVLNRVDLRPGFHCVGPVGFAGAAVLGISLWPFAHEILCCSTAGK